MIWVHQKCKIIMVLSHCIIYCSLSYLLFLCVNSCFFCTQIAPFIVITLPTVAITIVEKKTQREQYRKEAMNLCTKRIQKVEQSDLEQQFLLSQRWKSNNYMGAIVKSLINNLRVHKTITSLFKCTNIIFAYCKPAL